ncbi:hypothetical protein HHK36_008994 [Tetracentron sinense]|uniref:Glutaredoxin-like protein n=1 Tax=Tetracentron sinense TaxID=13715 RepID=A0A834ZB00_TETSI|nr:hypothetical protein HHK36_008994 [Tetracentron sinense]
MAIGAAAAPSSMAFLTRQRAKWVFTPLASSFSAQSNPSLLPSKKLLLYTKPGCCLCDGLKEKLQAAFSLAGPDSLHDVHLQIRDITSNPEWERSYQYEIPVLARVLSDGTEVKECEFIIKVVVEGDDIHDSQAALLNTSGRRLCRDRSQWMNSGTGLEHGEKKNLGTLIRASGLPVLSHHLHSKILDPTQVEGRANFPSDKPSPWVIRREEQWLENASPLSNQPLDIEPLAMQACGMSNVDLSSPMGSRS